MVRGDKHDDAIAAKTVAETERDAAIDAKTTAKKQLAVVVVRAAKAKAERDDAIKVAFTYDCLAGLGELLRWLVSWRWPLHWGK